MNSRIGWLALAIALIALDLPDGVAVQTARASVAAPLDPASIAEGRKLVDLVLPPERRQAMMASVLTAMLGNIVSGELRGNGLGERLEKSPSAKRVFAAFMARQRALALADVDAMLPDLIEAYARAYARLFTIDEMKQTEAFLATPAGVKFAARADRLLSDPDVSALQQQIASKEAARQRPELTRFRADLQAAFAADARDARAS